MLNFSQLDAVFAESLHGSDSFVNHGRGAAPRLLLLLLLKSVRKPNDQLLTRCRGFCVQKPVVLVGANSSIESALQ